MYFQPVHIACSTLPPGRVMMAAARQESTLFSPDRGISRSFGVIPVFVAVVAERSKALVLGTSLRARVRIPPTVSDNNSNDTTISFYY